MSIGDLNRDDVLALVPDVAALEEHPKIKALLDLADEVQQLWQGSFVAIHLLVNREDLIVREGFELSDRTDIYSVRIAGRVEL